jgi:hypothetical protein
MYSEMLRACADTDAGLSALSDSLQVLYQRNPALRFANAVGGGPPDMQGTGSVPFRKGVELKRSVHDFFQAFCITLDYFHGFD